jgi:hypothetical protein
MFFSAAGRGFGVGFEGEYALSMRFLRQKCLEILMDIAYSIYRLIKTALAKPP